MKIKSKKRTTLILVALPLLFYTLYPKHQNAVVHKTSVDDADYVSWLENSANNRQPKLPTKLNKISKPLTDCHENSYPLSGTAKSRASTTTPATALVGILTTAEKLERRMLIRNTVLQDQHVPSHVDFPLRYLPQSNCKTTTPLPV
jgi:hypothetical protein